MDLKFRWLGNNVVAHDSFAVSVFTEEEMEEDNLVEITEVADEFIQAQVPRECPGS